MGVYVRIDQEVVTQDYHYFRYAEPSGTTETVTGEYDWLATNGTYLEAYGYTIGANYNLLPDDFEDSDYTENTDWIYLYPGWDSYKARFMVRIARADYEDIYHAFVDHTEVTKSYTAVALRGTVGATYVGERPEDGEILSYDLGDSDIISRNFDDPPVYHSYYDQGQLAYRSYFWVQVQVSLFSALADVVDFNALTDEQVEALTYGGFLDAEGGDDTVTLPSWDTLNQLDISIPRFDLGDGNDTIVATDFITDIDGGAGDDTFDFSNADYSGWSYQDFAIDGGDGDDVAYLPFAANDYRFDIDLASSWEATVTTIRGTTASTAIGSVRNVEKVIFADKMRNEVSLTNGSLVAEASAQMVEIYDGADVATARRGWRDVLPMELGLPAVGTVPGGTYTFAPGLLTLSGSGIAGYLKNDSHVSITAGVTADGVRTLMVTFKGSNDPKDFGYDIAGVKPFYEKHAVFVDALVDYLNDGHNGIERVVVTGHSLGGALTQHLLHDLTARTSGVDLVGYTFGSIGAKNAPNPGNGLINFLHTGDIASLLNKPIDTRAGATVYLQPETGLFESDGIISAIRASSPLTGAALAALNNSIALHKSPLYRTDATKLLAEAHNSSSLFYSSALAAALRNGTDWAGETGGTMAGGRVLQIFAGGSEANVYAIDAGDDYVLGGGGDDRFTLASPAATTRRHIDGGSGTDRLIIHGNASDFRVTGGTLQRRAGDGWAQVAEINSIELLIYRDLIDRILGTETVQKLTGASVTLKSGIDYAVAGTGTMSIKGTSSSDTLYLGRGNKTVSMGSGDDIVIVKPTSSSQAAKDKVTLDGGKGADIMHGGVGSETFIVDNVRDVVRDEGGKDTIKSSVDYRLPEEIETLTLTGSAKTGLGSSKANTLNGNSKSNILDGMGGKDTLSGGSGKDTLIGGAGKDKLTGGSDKDTFVFNTALGSSNVDTITDFTRGQDKIALDKTIFAAIGSKLDKSEFYAKAGATKANDKSDRIVYDTKTGKLYYDADGKGGAGAIHFATLSNKSALDYGDFLII